MDRISHVFGSVSTHNRAFLIGSSVAATLTVLTIARLTLYSAPPKIIPSPRNSLLPTLSQKEREDLPYPPDVFPGARDVHSPVCSVTFTAHDW